MDTALRAELLRRMDIDQAARHARDMAAVAAADADNLPWLQQVVAEHGWPGASMVGTDGAHAAWLLAQHADRDPAFQRECLGLLAAAVEAGEATRSELAYLTDRVLLAEGQPQEYGTQVTVRDGQHVPNNLRDPDTADQRRAAMDLTPLADYLKLFSEPPPQARQAWLRCPGCGAPAAFEPADGAEPVTVTCANCGRRATIMIKRPGS
ncbi:MAG TPA: DUF6624 domain-containing protein [Streptosporangiaceae bacterium]|nr:DUF6624 domain-containing protein [Streptosporangiaceae bacterium]